MHARTQVPAPSAPAPPEFKEQPPADFKEAQGWKQAQPNDGQLKGKWWEIYNDPELNALEERVAIDNQNVKLLRERRYTARAQLSAWTRAVLPTVGIGRGRRAGQQSSRKPQRHVRANPARSLDVCAACRLRYLGARLWGRVRNAGGATWLGAGQRRRSRKCPARRRRRSSPRLFPDCAG